MRAGAGAGVEGLLPAFRAWRLQQAAACVLKPTVAKQQRAAVSEQPQAAPVSCLSGVTASPPLRPARHLNGAHLEEVTSRPALLVVDAACAAIAPLERARREAALLEALLAALRAGGNALLPVDTAGRVLELLLLLDAYWEEHK